MVREPGRERAWYEARLNSSTVGSLNVDANSEALVDSGASHPFTPVATDAELRDAKRVVVSLATGEERSVVVRGFHRSQWNNA